MLIWVLGTGLPQQLPESHSKLQTPGPVLQQRKKTSSRARGKFQSPALPLQWAWSRLASSRGHRNPLPSRKTQRFVFPEMSEMLQSTPPSKRKSRAQPLGPRMGFSARTPQIACKRCMSAQAPFLGDPLQPSSQPGRGCGPSAQSSPTLAQNREAGRPRQLSGPINRPAQCVGVGRQFVTGRMIRTDNMRFGAAHAHARAPCGLGKGSVSHCGAEGARFVERCRMKTPERQLGCLWLGPAAPLSQTHPAETKPRRIRSPTWMVTTAVGGGACPARLQMATGGNDRGPRCSY